MWTLFKRLRKLLKKKSRGFSAIIIVAAIPLIVYGVNYLIKYTQKAETEISNFEIPYIIGKNIAKAFNPGRTWSEQEECLYSIAAQTYNDEAYDSEKKMKFNSVEVVRAGSSTENPKVAGLFDLYTDYSTYGRQLNAVRFIDDEEMFVGRPPFSDFIYNEANNSVVYTKYMPVTSGTVVYSASKYEKDEGRLKLSLTSSGTIQVQCPELKRNAEVTLPRNDVDIVIAIPTNRASNTTSNDNAADFGDYANKNTADQTPIKQIARACQVFLQPFLHTVGVAVGIVPYSGKVSISPYRDSDIVVETPLNRNPTGGLTYAVQAMFYGSDGKEGGNVILHKEEDESSAYGSYLDWGSESYGRPIMARRGQKVLYRGMYMNSGAITDKTESDSLLLDMTTPPSTSEDDYKFMQMNTNPCYLGFCNTLAMLCEKDCPTYRTNPYFMTELTSDVQSLIYDLELFVPFKDEYNKSNFLFLPIVMAGNMFSWGEHPSELPTRGRVKETPRQNKSRVLIVIANAPDNFEPQELTYLGFNNDYSEIPMIESDMILFNKDRGYVYKDGKYQGVKGAVQFSTSDGSLNSNGYLFKSEDKNRVMHARITFPNKGLIKIVAERENPATVTIYGDNGVEDNVGTYTFFNSKIFNFSGPQQVYNWADLGTSFTSGNYTTKGVNFGHNTSTKKVKLKFSGCKLSKSTLTNQILRFYGTYGAENGKSLIGSRKDPCISLGGSGQWADAGSYIKAHGFAPTCYGVSNLSKFIMAASVLFDDAIIDDDVKINSSSKGGVKHNSGTSYRVYSGGSSSGSTTVDTGRLQIESYYYYKLFASEKHRTRHISQSITTTRKFPQAAENAGGVASSECCSIIWNHYRIPTIVDSSCNSTSHTELGSYSTSEVDSCGGCSSTTYQTNCTVSNKMCTATNTKTGQAYTYVCGKTESCSSASAPSTCGDAHNCKPYDCNCRKVQDGYEYYDCNCKNVEYDCPYDCNCQTLNFVRPCSGGSCPSGYSIEHCECVYTDTSLNKTKYYSCVNGGCPWGSIHKCYCEGSETKCEKCPKTCTRKECETCSKPKYKTVCDTCYKTCYWCQKASSYTQTSYHTGCQTATWEDLYEKAGYNNSPGCSGVCYDSVVTDYTGWTKAGGNSSISCSERTPTTTYRESYSIDQAQDSKSCTFSESSADNSSCSYSSISVPPLSYAYSSCGNSVSGSSSSSGANVSSWIETPTEQKRFYAHYPRTIDGDYNSTQYSICDTSGNDCTSTSYSGSTSLQSTGTRDDSKTVTSAYRYPLYNFFFVDSGPKSTSYTYSNYTLTSKISSDSDSNLVNNQGIYLLPTGEEDTYWLCFCGDANLQLDFTDATDASIAFSNINPIQYQVKFGDSATQTVGVAKNYIDTREVLYIHPDQITDNLDEDGNYYVDLTIKGQPRILSVELTNRPLKARKLSASELSGEIVDHDASGGKVIGDEETEIELKLRQKVPYSLTAQPVTFWIEGPSDFRQTSGTVRICSTSNKTPATVKADVPDNGGGKITITVGQPVTTYKQSDTGVWVDEVTPNYTYTIASDRKLKSINVPSFVAPKVVLSGAVSGRNYTFCSKEVNEEDSDSAKKLFDWPLTSFSHSTVDNGSEFTNKTCTGVANKLNFDLTACKLVEAKAENLIMQFSPTVNDFPSVIVSNGFNDPIHHGAGVCDDSVSFVEDANSSVVCGDLEGEGEVDCRAGYWLPRSVCTNSGYYILRGSTLTGWETDTKVDMTDTFKKYGPGTIRLYAYRGVGPVSVTLYAGASNAYYGKDHQDSFVYLSGICNSADDANVRMKETIEYPNYTGFNYLNSCYYQAKEPCDLIRSGLISYFTQDTAKHNYKGVLNFYGIGDIRVYIQPQKVKTSNYYTRDMSESEVSGSFGNYKYTFSEQDYLLNLEDEELTAAKSSFELLYSTGTIGTSTANAGNHIDYSVSTTSYVNNYYYTDINAKNVLVTVPATVVSTIDGEILTTSQQEVSPAKTFTISPYTHTYEERSDGYYYVKLKCRNVVVSNLQAFDNLLIYYDHPNIISDNLKNTRIIDGYDQATNRNMMLYGNMNYNNMNLPAVSAVQELFYNVKNNNAERYFFPRISGVGGAEAEEEGDFFIHIWDHNNEVPAVRWKISDAIQSSTADISVSGTGFGPFKSNYAFNGLHRMFFPYNTYNKDYAGYSYAYNSALVFAGYTLPINYVLYNNGYQQIYPLSSGQVSDYTKPTTALENLAKDACAKFKTDLSNGQGAPLVFLVKYRTNDTLSLESCADYVFTANDEENLLKIMRQISLDIEKQLKASELRVNVSDTKN